MRGILVALPFVFSCQEPTKSQEVTLEQPVAATYVRPSEGPLRTIAAEVSSFGGYFCEAGNLVVLDAQPNSQSLPNPQTAAALTALISPKTVSSCWDRRRKPSYAPHVVVRSAKYSFTQLKNWRDATVDSFLELEGAVGVAISYRSNRLRMWAQPWALQVTSAFVSSLGIPSDAYEVFSANALGEDSECPAEPETLSDCFLPVPGAALTLTTENGSNQGSEACTMGMANARLMDDFWQDGWITNSHCVPPIWRMESSWLWQPGLTNDDFIGFEFLDPPGWTCGSRECRYSDAAWIWASPNTAGQIPERGKIAKPFFNESNDLGFTTMDAPSPRFFIRDYRYSIEEMRVDKVGISTGWTSSQVTVVCGDFNRESDGRDLRMICQDRSPYFRADGDSGSPVFFVRPGPGETNVDIVGIHWGADFDGTGIGTFSPWDGIVADLGLIVPYAPNFAGGGIVTASSSVELQDWGLERVVDGILTSVSGSYGYSSELGIDNDHTEWLEIELPSIQPITQVILYPRSDEGHVGDGFPIEFAIQIWDLEHGEWIDRVVETGYQKPFTSEGEEFTWAIPDYSNRVRVNASGLRAVDGEYVLQFAEVSVY